MEWDKTEILKNGKEKVNLLQVIPERGWTRPYYDLVGTKYYPYGSTKRVVRWEVLWTAPRSQNRFKVLTGDVIGDEKLEVVVLDYSSTESAPADLKVFSHNGTLLWSTSIPGDGCFGERYISLGFLEDVDGDGKKEIFITNTLQCSNWGTSTAELIVYKGDGSIIKRANIPQVLGDGPTSPCALFRKASTEVWIGVGSNYHPGGPRGVFVMDYSTGGKIWFYRFGPWSMCPNSAADVNGDGELEFVIGGTSTSNGVDGRGRDDVNDAPPMYDYSAWFASFDYYGYTIFARDFGYGNVYGTYADLDSDGNFELYSFKSIHTTFTNCYIYELNPSTGSTIRQVLVSTSCQYLGRRGIGDVNNDGKNELLVRFLSSDGTTPLAIVDYNFNVIATFPNADVLSITDFDGDGENELLIIDRDEGKLKIIDGDMTTTLWGFQIDGGGITSDIDLDDMPEIIAWDSSTLYVLDPLEAISCCIVLNPNYVKTSSTPGSICGPGEDAEFKVEVLNCSPLPSSVEIVPYLPLNWRIFLENSLSDSDGDGLLDFNLGEYSSETLTIRIRPPEYTEPSRAIIRFRFNQTISVNNQTVTYCLGNLTVETEVLENREVLITHSSPKGIWDTHLNEWGNTKRLQERPVSLGMTQTYGLDVINCGNVQEEVLVGFQYSPNFDIWITDRRFGRLISDHSGNPLRELRLLPGESREIQLHLTPLTPGILETIAVFSYPSGNESAVDFAYLTLKVLSAGIDNQPPPSERYISEKKTSAGRKLHRKRAPRQTSLH